MATLTVQQVTQTGLNPSLVAAAGGGDEFVNGGDIFVEVDNQDASATTVTFETARQVEGFDVDDLAVSVPAGERRLIGPSCASSCPARKPE